MYVCLCKGVTDRAIRREVNAGASTFREVRDNLGVGTQCGKCACDAREIIADALPAEDTGVAFFDAAFAPA